MKNRRPFGRRFCYVAASGSRGRELTSGPIIAEPASGNQDMELAPLSGGVIGTRVPMDISDGILPAVMDTTLIDEIVAVTDEEVLACARRLACEEGLLADIPSGTNMAAGPQAQSGQDRGRPRA